MFTSHNNVPHMSLLLIQDHLTTVTEAMITFVKKENIQEMVTDLSKCDSKASDNLKTDMQINNPYSIKCEILRSVYSRFLTIIEILVRMVCHKI